MRIPSHIREMIAYGIKAPSGHNTQPWKYLVKENEIQIHPDLERALPVVDHDNHALYISLGCAAENTMIAANHLGYHCVSEVIGNDKDTSFIKLRLHKNDATEKDDLVHHIEHRQSTRNSYTTKKVPRLGLETLQHSFDFEGVRVKIVTTPQEIKKLAPFIIEGSNRQFKNHLFVNELVSWVRFSKAEAQKKRDGIWHASMGMPSVGRTIGSLIMKNFISAKSEAKRWKKQIEASAGFALFTVEKNDVAHWVRLGRAFQRFGLTATKLGINHAHVNMPCEEVDVRKKLANHFDLNQHPLLLIRFGFSKKMPYSVRRDVQEVILNAR